MGRSTNFARDAGSGSVNMHADILLLLRGDPERQHDPPVCKKASPASSVVKGLDLKCKSSVRFPRRSRRIFPH
eukprot:4432541-Prymnesium_polylepis.1